MVVSSKEEAVATTTTDLDHDYRGCDYLVEAFKKSLSEDIHQLACTQQLPEYEDQEEDPDSEDEEEEEAEEEETEEETEEEEEET